MIRIHIYLIKITNYCNQNVTAAATSPTKIAPETAKLFRDLLSSQKNNYFKVIDIKGSKQPALLVSDGRTEDKAVTVCDIYIVKTIKRNEPYTQKLVKVGHIKSESSGYYIWQYDGKLISGSHHYTSYAEIKKGKLFLNYYQGKFDKIGNETFYHLIYSDNKLVSKKKISASKGKKYVYNFWDRQNDDNILVFYKNTKSNRANFL